MDLNGLQIAMGNWCFHCGRGGEAVIEYVKENDGDPARLYHEALELNDWLARGFIGILLSSNYNVFQPWFKSLLIYFRDYRSGDLLSSASDILDFYKKAFDEVGELYEI